MEKKEKEKPLNEVADERRHTEAMEYTKGLLERMTQDEQLVQALEQRIERVFDKKMQEWMQQVNEKKGVKDVKERETYYPSPLLLVYQQYTAP